MCQPKPDWDSSHKICGFLNIKDPGQQWEIPDDLARFIMSDSPPVYMTFGSMMTLDQPLPLLTETTHLMVEAALLANCRAIVQSCWEKIEGIPDNSNIFRISAAPYTYIFPHCSVIVHHGGAGTTQTVLLSGRPSVVVEHIADQVFWGRTLNRLNVAPKPLHRRSLTASKLAKKIKEVLNSPEMFERANKLGKLMEKEDGVKCAVSLIEEVSKQ